MAERNWKGTIPWLDPSLRSQRQSFEVVGMMKRSIRAEPYLLLLLPSRGSYVLAVRAISLSI